MEITYTDDGLVIFKCSEFLFLNGKCITEKCHGYKLNDKTDLDIRCSDGFITLSWRDYLTYKNTYKEF